MSDEEKPADTIRPAQTDSPSRPASLWTVRRIVTAAVTITTLLGGLWTVVQFSEWFLNLVGREKLDPGWRRVKLQGSGSIAMPQTWDIVDKQALLAQGSFSGMNQGMVDLMRGAVEDESTLSFMMEVKGPWPPSVAAVAAMRKFKWDEKMMIKRLQDRGFIAKSDKLNDRPTIHAIRNLPYLNSDPPIQLAQIIYFIDLPGEPWMVSYHVDASMHLDYSGTFRRMTESLKVQ
jgi:hypothetical protein